LSLLSSGGLEAETYLAGRIDARIDRLLDRFDRDDEPKEDQTCV
jgi:hypothetical protein